MGLHVENTETRELASADHEKIHLTGSGDTIIVPALAERRIAVYAYHLVCDQAVTLKWKSGATDISGLMSFAANGGITVPFCARGVLKTALGEPLVLASGGDVIVGGALTYGYTEN